MFGNHFLVESDPLLDALLDFSERHFDRWYWHPPHHTRFAKYAKKSNRWVSRMSPAHRLQCGVQGLSIALYKCILVRDYLRVAKPLQDRA